MSQTPPDQFDATVLITTKNRRDELRLAVASAIAQRGCAIEVLVIDDGSNDGTAEMIRDEFPAVRLERSERSLGLIVQRTRGAGLARSPIIVSIDDDARLPSPDTVKQTLADFDDARIGAVAIPFVNVLHGSDVLQRASAKSEIFITESYIGTAHALRRQVFLDLGGYRQHLFHQCEEEDYCLRLLNAGFFVRLGRADPIEHRESPRRSYRRMTLFNARNHILFGWHNVPMPYCLAYWPATTFNLLRHGWRRRQLAATIEGLLRGCTAVLAHPAERRPVSGRIYLLSRRLKRQPMNLCEVNLTVGRKLGRCT